MLLLIKAPSAIIDAIKRIAKSVRDARSKQKTNKTNNHHIVAKAAAKPARDILSSYAISINHKVNIVKLNMHFHQHLHTTQYYTGVNTVVAKGDEVAKKAGVFAALLILHGALKLTNMIFF